MDGKMISIVRILSIVGVVILLYLANTESRGDPAILLFKLIFCGGGMFFFGYGWVIAEKKRSAYKRKEERHIHSNDKNLETKIEKIYITEKKESTAKNVIIIIAALATIVSAIVMLLK